jgi:hypothetical protein
LQDVFRKLTPGIPAAYVLWSFLVFALVGGLALLQGRFGRIKSLYLGSRRLRTAWIMFAVVVLVQAAHALLRWGHPAMPLLGLIFYFGPIAALLLAERFARAERDMKAWLKAYVALMVPVVLTVYLSLWFGDSIAVLSEIGSFVGRQLLIYDVGTVLASHSGLLRVGEIAAWHGATAVAFLSILATVNKSLAMKIGAGILIVLLIGAIILTGRRKMLVAIAIFFAVQWALLAIYRRGAVKQAVTVALVALVGWFALAVMDPALEAGAYLTRGASVFGDVGERSATAFDLYRSALVRSKGIGLGAGTTAQGTQFIGGSVAGGAAEAGLGKIVVELGPLGGVVVLWLLYNLATRFGQLLRILARVDDRLLYYAASFGALLIANMATFAVATQVFGDPFILINLGMIAGFLFAVSGAGLMAQRAGGHQGQRLGARSQMVGG